MKRIILIGIASVFFSSVAIYSPVKAQSGSPTSEEPYSGQPLCLPDAYLAEPSGCLPLGPSQFLTNLAKVGLTIPPQPLPAYSPDPALSAMTEQYLRIGVDTAIPVYPSLEGAQARSGASRSIAGGGGLRYLAILQRVDDGNGSYFQLMSGEWINGGEAGSACCTAYGRYQGLLFRKTPPRSFGWVLTPTKTKREPSYAAADTGRELPREALVQVYDTQLDNGTTWLMIGIDEWIDDHFVGKVTPTSNPPEGVTTARWIEVNLGEQSLSVYQDQQLIFATLITTGVEPFYTRPGLFQIYKKKELETMSGSFEADRSDYYYLEDVPWTMYFDSARALHGAYWRTTYGYPGSHGCVNLSPGDSHWLFEWAQEGDWVYVWDPTGQTPTDPAYYGDGGA